MQKIIFIIEKIKKYQKCPALWIVSSVLHYPPEPKSILETFHVGPNPVLALLKKRVRGGLKRLKNRPLDVEIECPERPFWGRGHTFAREINVYQIWFFSSRVLSSQLWY